MFQGYSKLRKTSELQYTINKASLSIRDGKDDIGNLPLRTVQHSPAARDLNHFNIS